MKVRTGVIEYLVVALSMVGFSLFQEWTGWNGLVILVLWAVWVFTYLLKIGYFNNEGWE